MLDIDNLIHVGCFLRSYIAYLIIHFTKYRRTGRVLSYQFVMKRINLTLSYIFQAIEYIFPTSNFGLDVPIITDLVQQADQLGMLNSKNRLFSHILSHLSIFLDGFI